MSLLWARGDGDYADGRVRGILSVQGLWADFESEGRRLLRLLQLRHRALSAYSRVGLKSGETSDLTLACAAGWEDQRGGARKFRS